jgi:hypothetical protein
MGSPLTWDPNIKKGLVRSQLGTRSQECSCTSEADNFDSRTDLLEFSDIYLASLAIVCFSLQVRRVLGKEGRVRIGVQVLKALKLTKRKPPEEVSH